MRSPSFIIAKTACLISLAVFNAVFAGAVFAQTSSPRVAVLAPDGTEAAQKYAASLSAALAISTNVLDEDMAAVAFRAVRVESPFNMTTVEARNVGSALGCDFYILVRSADQRRSSSERETYYESYAAIFVVSMRTGRLVDWVRPKFEAPSLAESHRMLFALAPNFAASLLDRLREVARAEVAETAPPKMEEVPADDSPLAANFRAPVPYRRIKPEYTSEAFFYEVSATVEIELDLDAAGSITRADVVRWAGYGLDRSVETAVRAMNWRPAYRDGKPLPMRVLLRYNFRRPDK